MDHLEAELSARAERIEKVIIGMALDGDTDALRVMGDNSLMQMKRTALINLTMRADNFIPPTILKAYVGMDVRAFIVRIRVRAAIERLS